MNEMNYTKEARISNRWREVAYLYGARAAAFIGKIGCDLVGIQKYTSQEHISLITSILFFFSIILHSYHCLL